MAETRRGKCYMVPFNKTSYAKPSHSQSQKKPTAAAPLHFFSGTPLTISPSHLICNTLSLLHQFNITNR
jgi:hypothetical protein